MVKVASPRTEEAKRTNAEVSLEEGQVSPVRGFSLGNVERLCQALELTGEKMDPLSPLLEATHTEVSKLRALADALRNEIDALELEADEARASRDAEEARASRGADEARASGELHASASPGRLLSISLELDYQEAGASSGAQEAPWRDLQGDVKVLKQQLEAVTVAYVRQGAALQAAKARLRRVDSASSKPVSGGQPVAQSVAQWGATSQHEKEKEDHAAEVHAPQSLDPSPPPSHSPSPPPHLHPQPNPPPHPPPPPHSHPEQVHALRSKVRHAEARASAAAVEAAAAQAALRHRNAATALRPPHEGAALSTPLGPRSAATEEAEPRPPGTAAAASWSSSEAEAAALRLQVRAKAVTVCDGGRNRMWWRL